jgi:peroxiredoxin (alkyl hydroperoxide reductase subunit C)
MERIHKKSALLLLAFLSCSIVALPQGSIPLLGEQAPSFKAKTTNGNLVFPEDFGNSWKILLSHPKDFTPVCTSEILALAKMQQDFDALGVKLAIVSTDDLSSHLQWKQLMEDILAENGGSEKISFPLLDDHDGRISNKYGMLHAWENPTRDVRGVFIIDPENKIRSINFYPMNIGRNMEEIKRVVTALQISEEEQVLMPADWTYGGDVLMQYVPYTEEDLQKDPSLKNQYYKVGVNLWYKKAD